jgi:hypothetical protein
VKLGDFGMAKNLLYTNQNLQNFVGTPLYLPPEIINNHPYSYKADIWALGIVFYELLALRTPFMDFSYHGLLVKICNAPIDPMPEEFSPELRNFVMNLLERDPEKRPAINDLFQLDFIIDALIKNPLELEIYKSMRNLENFQITENGLKRDFHALKTYRFSEYVGTSNISPLEKDSQLQETKNFVKPSRFGAVQNNHILPISGILKNSNIDSSQINFNETELINQSVGQESEIFQESPLTAEISENNKLNYSEASTRKESVIISAKQSSTFKNVNGFIFNDSVIDSNNNSQAVQNSHKSINLKISLCDLKYSRTNSDTFMKSEISGDLQKNNHALQSNLLVNKISEEDVDFKISDFPSFANQNSDEHLDKFDSRDKVNMLLLKESKIQKSDNDLLSPVKTQKILPLVCSPISQNEKKVIKNAKPETSISKYQQLSKLKKISSLENNQTKKFKIHNIKTGVKPTGESQSNLNEINLSKMQKPVQKSRPKVHTATTIDKIDSCKSKNKVYKGHNEYGDLRNDLNPRQNNFKIPKKSLSSSATSITKFNFEFESQGDKITNKLNKKDTSHLLSAKIIKKGDKSKVVSYQDVNRIYRKSHVPEIEALKEKFIEKFQGKFGLVYSAIKRFVINTGLKEIEGSISDEKKIISLVNSFNKDLLSIVKSPVSLVELIKLNILEIKSDLL